MIRAASLAIDFNLLRFSQYLRYQAIAHRITEESGQQIVWVETEIKAREVSLLLKDWSFEEASDAESSSPRTTNANLARWKNNFLHTLVSAFLSSPLTLSLLVICLIVAVVSELGYEAQRVSWLFFPSIASDGLFSLLADIDSFTEVVRSFTPMFLHFGELHLVFNMLWLWYFGKQLESSHPKFLFLLLILLTSFASNSSQYLYSGTNNFGGMSGVVYGLVGYTWLVHTFMPRSTLLINSNMFVVFVIALIAMEVVASSWIATAAHVGGLLTGLIVGVVTVFVYRVGLNREIISKTGGAGKNWDGK